MALYLGSKKAVKGNYKGGVDASGVTTIPSDLKAGKYYVDSNGTLTAGTMPTVTHPTPSITVSSGGVITATSTLGTSGYIESGVKSATKSLTTKGATYYTPSTSNQTISSGQYLTGTQTIYGDANLVSSNIKSGTSIFGVAGSYTGGKTYYGETAGTIVIGIDTAGSVLDIPIDSIYTNVTPTSFAIARVDKTPGGLIYAMYYDGICRYCVSTSNEEYTINAEENSSSKTQFYWEDNNLLIYLVGNYFINSDTYRYTVSYN